MPLHTNIVFSTNSMGRVIHSTLMLKVKGFVQMTLRKWDHLVIYEPRRMRNVISSKDFSNAWRTRMSFYLKKPFLPHAFAYLWPVRSISHPTQTEFSSQISSSSPQQINRVNLIHTASSEPSQNKAVTPGEVCLLPDSCRSAHITPSHRKHRYYHHRCSQEVQTVFKPKAWWIHCYCFQFSDEDMLTEW